VDLQGKIAPQKWQFIRGALFKASCGEENKHGGKYLTRDAELEMGRTEWDIGIKRKDRL
jgi:hypothetical protein